MRVSDAKNLKLLTALLKLLDVQHPVRHGNRLHIAEVEHRKVGTVCGECGGDLWDPRKPIVREIQVRQPIADFCAHVDERLKADSGFARVHFGVDGAEVDASDARKVVSDVDEIVRRESTPSSYRKTQKVRTVFKEKFEHAHRIGYLPETDVDFLAVERSIFNEPLQSQFRAVLFLKVCTQVDGAPKFRIK